MPRTYEPAVETYELVTRERKSELRRQVRGALSDVRTTLLALSEDPAERAIIAAEYLRQHAAAVKIDGATQTSLWVETRTKALRSLRERGHKPIDLARHLGVTLQQVGNLLAYRGASRGPYRPAGRPARQSEQEAPAA